MDDTPIQRPRSTSARRRGRPASAPAGRDTGKVQAIHRALELLEAMSERPQGITLTELARRADLAPSTTHRLLKSLEQMQFVRHDEERSLWQVGVKAFTVGSAFLQARDLVATARPFMRRLMEESGESVNLAVAQDRAAVLLTQVECQEMIRALGRPGGRAPMHCSGMGKALLAAMSEHERAAVLAEARLERFTPKTLATIEELQRDLEIIRARGFAVDDEEFAVGLRCVAAVIHDEHGEATAAVSLSGPSARITDERLDALGALVATTAGEITAALGGRAPTG